MNVELKLWLKEMVSDGVRKMEAVTRSSFGGITRTVDNAQKHFNATGKSISELNRRLDELHKQRDLKVDTRDIAAANREVAQLERRVNNLQNMGTRNGGGGLGRYATGAFWGNLGAQGVMKGGRAAMGELGSLLGGGLYLGKIAQQFEVLAGADKGKGLFGEMRQWVRDSVFGPEQYKNARTMMAFGIAPDEVMKDLKMLGDVSMGDVERMEQLTLAFSQTRSAGKLMGQDLLQYTTAGFNPLMVLAEKTGKSYAKLKEDMSAGKVSADMVRQAFQLATGEGGKYYRMLEKQANTPGGKLDQVTGSWADTKASFGLALAPAVKRMLDGVTPILEKMPAFFDRITPGITKFFDGVSAAMPTLESFGSAVWGILEPVGELVTKDEMGKLAKNVVDLGTKILETATPAVQALAEAATLAAGGLNSAVSILKDLTSEWEQNRKAFGVDTEGEMLKDFMKTIKTAKQDLMDWLGIKVPGGVTKEIDHRLPRVPKSMYGGQKKEKEKESNGSSSQIDAITGGGKKMITINFNKAVVEQTFRVGSMKEAAEVGRAAFEEMYLRVIQATLARI